LIKSQMLCQLS